MANTTATVQDSGSVRRRMLAEFWYYFSENRGAVIGLWIFVLLVITAIFAPVLAPYGPAEKQALLEAADLKTRASTLIAITEMALAQDRDDFVSSLQ